MKKNHNVKKFMFTFLPLIPIFIATFYQINYVTSIADGLSPIADPFSESNAIRAGEYYSDFGLFSHMGLPTISYGDRFPMAGSLSGAVKTPEQKVEAYTHYPPGPDLMVGIMTILTGKGNISSFRVLPMTIHFFASIYLAATLTHILGVMSATTIMSLIAILPLYSNMMHGLHYQGTALAFLIFQIALLIKILLRKGPVPRSSFYLLFGIAYLQGWFSIDYIFLVSFLSIPFLILSKGTETEKSIKSQFFTFILPPLGFGLALVLHFIQVCFYYGSFKTAWSDFVDVGAARRIVTSPEMMEQFSYFSQFPHLLVHYVFDQLPQPVYFGSLAPLCVAILVLLMLSIPNVSVKLGHELRLKFSVAWQVRSAVFAAFVICSLWVILMAGHSFMHRHFIPRHYFLVYFMLIFGFISSFQVLPSKPVK